MSDKKAKYYSHSDFAQNLKEEILAFIKGGAEQVETEEKYNALALRLFEY